MYILNIECTESNDVDIARIRNSQNTIVCPLLIFLISIAFSISACSASDDSITNIQQIRLEGNLAAALDLAIICSAPSRTLLVW